MNDQIRRRRHTGTHDQGSEVRVQRVQSLMGAKNKQKKTSFPVKFCALDSAFGTLHAAAYTSKVQQGAGRFLQLLIQLWLNLTSCPLADRPLDGRRTSRSLVNAPLIPEIGVLVAVEALAAGTVRLSAVAASFIQGGKRWGGGTGRAALQGYTAVVVVLLWITAHQDWVRSGQVQWAVRIAWGEQKLERVITIHSNGKGYFSDLLQYDKCYYCYYATNKYY